MEAGATPSPAGMTPVARLRGIFVTGPGPGGGKSVLSAGICAALADRGEKVAAFKPVITGLDERGGDWPLDDELLARHANAGQSREEVSPHRFGPPVSPHLAAEMAGEQIEPLQLAREAREWAEKADALVCEGIGGAVGAPAGGRGGAEGCAGRRVRGARPGRRARPAAGDRREDGPRDDQPHAAYDRGRAG